MSYSARARQFLKCQGLLCKRPVLDECVSANKCDCDRQVEALAALLAEVAGDEKAIAGVVFAALPDKVAGVEYAVCLDGRWRGWLFRRHPDGQWVSVRPLATEAPVGPAGGYRGSTLRDVPIAPPTTGPLPPGSPGYAR